MYALYETSNGSRKEPCGFRLTEEESWTFKTIFCFAPFRK